jgi:hypothetical protein
MPVLMIKNSVKYIFDGAKLLFFLGMKLICLPIVANTIISWISPIKLIQFQSIHTGIEANSKRTKSFQV